MPKKALIIGVTGQDGAYLSRHLLDNGYEVHGTSRDAELASKSGLTRLGIERKIKLHSVMLSDFRSVLQTMLNVEPDEIYNLGGQSSVGLSFTQPVETLQGIALGTINILEVIRFHGMKSRFYNAGSSECFGDTGTEAASEGTPFKPRSPYAVAKSTAFWEVANYRDAYGVFAVSGILFNHESPLRPERFVTRKIIKAACAASKGSKEPLRLGNLKVSRDWGWAPEYVVAMQKLLQLDQPTDIVIGTGHSITLEEFVQKAFAFVGLDYRKYLQVDSSLFRPSDIMHSQANPAKAKKILGWEAAFKSEDVIRMLMEEELKSKE